MRGSIVKFGKTLSEEHLWKSCGNLHVWQSYGNCLYQKVDPSWEVRLPGIGFLTGCKGVSGYCYHCWILGAIFMGCIDICLEKKKGRFWGEADDGYLPSGSNKVKVWRCWSGLLELGSLGSPHGSRMGSLPWVISCRLFRLNPIEQGEHFISHYSHLFALSS